MIYIYMYLGAQDETWLDGLKILELPGLWEVFPCKVLDTALVYELG